MSGVYLYFTNPADGAVYAYDEDQVAMGYGSDMIPLVGDALEAYLHPPPTPEQLALIARSERDRQLKEIYDPGIQMIRRELEMTSDPDLNGLLISKRNQVNQYAKDLQDLPEQSGFPQVIVWPEIPTKDLE